MCSFFRQTIRALTLLCSIGIFFVNAAPQGWVEGHVKIFPLSDVNLADDATEPNAAAEQPYSEYPLIVRSRNGEKEIARVIADKDGNYRVALPPGDYVLDVQGRKPEGHLRAKPQPFTVVADQTVRVDMDIDTGVR
jgi:hypothetical protein